MGAWLVKAYGDDRTYGGNEGYPEAPTTEYRYDSQVANHKRVATGDTLVVCNRERPLGLATVSQIEVEPGKKDLNRCPRCTVRGKSKRRKVRRPIYRCSACGHQYDVPIVDTVDVTLYKASYDGLFKALPASVDLAAVQLAGATSDKQNAIRRLDWDLLVPVIGTDPRLNQPDRHARKPLLAAGDAAEDADLPDDDPEVRITRSIRVRRGQRAFRQRLLRLYDNRCAITGDGPVDVLEAAHVEPHAVAGRNDPRNGILLRTDLHVLFDVGLLTVEPETRRVYIHRSILDTPYGVLHDRPLRARTDDGPSRDFLRTRWHKLSRTF